MKTNKILMAMVLAAGFTACTSEELVESTQTNALDSRKALGDIEFVMGGVDSRFAQTEEGWVVEATDAFGAVLVDEPNTNKDKYAWKNYNLTNYIQTNYQYAKGEGNVFTTPARMVEGNYVFYAPYNPKHLTRSAMKTAFPITQTLDVVDGVVDPYSTINNAVAEGYPFFIDYKFLSAEDQETSLEINFKHIYAYPEVKFVNETEEAIDIEKFIVRLGATTTVSANGELNFTGGSSSYAAAASKGIVGNLFNLGTELKTGDTAAEGKFTWGAWAKSDATNGKTGNTSDVVSETGAAKTTHIVVEIPEGLTVEAGEEVVFNIVLPAESYSALTMYAMVDAEKGYATSSISAEFAPGKRYPKTDYKENGELKTKVGSKFTFTIEENEKAKSQPNAVAPIVVSSTEELKDAIAAAEKSTLSVITGEDVVFNASVAEVLKESDVVTMLTILGDITVDGVAPAAATTANPALGLTKVDFQGVTTIKNIVTAGVDLNEVIVLKDATLNVGGKVAKLTNNGTVNAKKNAVIKASTNNNIMNIDDKTADVTVDNYKTLNINASATVALDNAFDTDATVGDDKFGTVNVAANFSTDKLEGYWNVNSGKLTVTAAATIAKKVKVAGKIAGEKLTVLGNATLEVSGRFDNPVELKGTKDADSNTAGAQPAIATLDLKEGATIGANVTAAASTDATCNLMKVADDVENLGGFAAINTICSKYSYTGNITGDNGAEGTDPVIPAICNTLDLTGSVKGTKGAINFVNYAGGNLTTINISGDVYTNGKDVTFEDGTTITVGGDVEANDQVITFGTSNVKVSGDLKIKYADGVASTGKIIVGGEIIATKNVAKDVLNVVVAKGDITTPSAASCDLRITTLHIEGDVTVSGTRTLASTQITVYEGKTLTNEGKISKINGLGGNKIKFVSSYKANHTVATEPTADKIAEDELVRGQVVNNKSVTDAFAAYKETGVGTIEADQIATGLGWWSGYAATL